MRDAALSDDKGTMIAIDPFSTCGFCAKTFVIELKPDVRLAARKMGVDDRGRVKTRLHDRR